MTRTLLLMRHGKAAWPDVPDHERPLAERGRREAALTGEWLLGQFGQFDAILCSTATRTRQTVDATGLIAPTTFHDEIYEAWPGQLLEVINQHAPAEAETLLVVGHAPGIPQLAATLADLESDPTAVAGLRSYPTSTVSVLSVPTGWATLEAGGATLTAVTTCR
ncbi:MAG TPA: histidine phosphatase family protein [Aeromicrobium sp.]|nr:histidine phosphatase family protein [Aeromicrobium sp.]